LEWKVKNVRDRYEKRSAYFFDTWGEENTNAVIDIILKRLKLGDIRSIVVASCTGKTAIKVAETLQKSKIKANLICVTGPQEYWRRTYPQNPLLGEPQRNKLENLGVKIIDDVMEPLQESLLFRNWWVKKSIKMRGEYADLFWMTLICVGGHGFRTAIEVVFTAVEVGLVKEGEKVLSIAGTGTGADSAIVMKASKFKDAVGIDPEKRLKVYEVLAMPKETKWVGYG